MIKKSVERIIELALSEDIGTGDVTTKSVVPEGTIIEGCFIARQKGVICGLDILTEVFAYLDSRVVCKLFCKDGDTVEEGDRIADITGPAHAVLSGERVALNFLQHLSGIATQAYVFSQMVAGTAVRIVDTRKTIPGLRVMEKYAVKTGGGYNHRMNLSDGILIKDNHIKAAGGITLAVKAARQNAPQTLKIEVETESLVQVQEALEAGADIIMLDNMSLERMKEAVELIAGRALTEASGNMDRHDLKAVAATGVDFISIGALTHSVKAMDISLKFR
ncbi:MAG: carboxylating nicotinate-nucleotide diphosphorylase [Bacteroidetes bacterium]|nr:MAG: carboxylating nicotinate-nucleotide diphosphorylase [Bacteroidota bacterium]